MCCLLYHNAPLAPLGSMDHEPSPVGKSKSIRKWVRVTLGLTTSWLLTVTHAATRGAVSRLNIMNGHTPRLLHTRASSSTSSQTS